VGIFHGALQSKLDGIRTLQRISAHEVGLWCARPLLVEHVTVRLNTAALKKPRRTRRSSSGLLPSLFSSPTLPPDSQKLLKRSWWTQSAGGEFNSQEFQKTRPDAPPALLVFLHGA